MAPVLDEERKIGEVVRRMPRDLVDEVLVIDDGSRDASAAVCRGQGATVIPLGATIGVGAALRAGYAYAVQEGYDVAVVVAGNNKDAPEDIANLLDPIADGRADFVQGSRWLHESRDLGAMPLYRRLATRLHPMLFSWAARRRVTDSTNGYRACTTRLLRDPRLDLRGRWLDRYELEPFLFLAACRLGYDVVEVPARKVYPPKALGQTKMKPVTGWWSILRPVLMVGAGIVRFPPEPTPREEVPSDE